MIDRDIETLQVVRQDKPQHRGRIHQALGRFYRYDGERIKTLCGMFERMRRARPGDRRELEECIMCEAVVEQRDQQHQAG